MSAIGVMLFLMRADQVNAGYLLLVLCIVILCYNHHFEIHLLVDRV
jgi:hypothetical protein